MSPLVANFSKPICKSQAELRLEGGRLGPRQSQCRQFLQSGPAGLQTALTKEEPEGSLLLPYLPHQEVPLEDYAARASSH